MLVVNSAYAGSGLPLQPVGNGGLSKVVDTMNMLTKDMTMSKMPTRTPILITGCQRSGTTLMNLILDSHPAIWGIDEDKFVFPSIYSYLAAPLPQAPPFVSFKLPPYAHILPFMEMLPGCRLLWCVRDPVDVVWSMVKFGSESGGTIPWAAHPAGGWGEINNAYWVLDDERKRELGDYMAEFAILTKKFVRLANEPARSMKIERRDSVFIGALCWRIKNELPDLYKDRKIDFHVIRYADLVRQPQEHIADALDYIGVDWDDQVLMHHRLHKGTSIGNTSNTRPIDQNSLGSGRKNLSEEEQALIKSICGKTARRWSYN